MVRQLSPTFLFSNPAWAASQGGYPQAGESPARFLVQNSPLNQVLHGLIGERIGNHSREVRTCSRGWVLPHFIYPTSIPALSCPQFLLERKGNRGRRKSPVVLGWGGFIPLQEGAIPALTRWNPSVQKVQGDPLQALQELPYKTNTHQSSQTQFFNVDLQNASQVLKIQDISWQHIWSSSKFPVLS